MQSLVAPVSADSEVVDAAARSLYRECTVIRRVWTTDIQLAHQQSAEEAVFKIYCIISEREVHLCVFAVWTAACA